MNFSSYKMSLGILILACLVIVAQSSSPYQESSSGEKSSSVEEGSSVEESWDAGDEASCSEERLDSSKADQPSNYRDSDLQIDPSEELKNPHRKAATYPHTSGSLPPRLSKRVNVPLTVKYSGQPALPESPEDDAEKLPARETKLEQPEEDHHVTEGSEHGGAQPVTYAFHPMTYDPRAWMTRPTIIADDPEARDITGQILDFFYGRGDGRGSWL